MITGCIVLSHFSHVRLSAVQWSVVHEASLSVGFSRQEYWSGLPCLPPGDLLHPGIKPWYPAGSLRCRQILYCMSHGSLEAEPEIGIMVSAVPQEA